MVKKQEKRILIQVKDSTRKRLHLGKMKMDLRNVDDYITYLLDNEGIEL